MLRFFLVLREHLQHPVWRWIRRVFFAGILLMILYSRISASLRLPMR